MQRYQWARIELALNLFGTILIAFALQIGSSEFRFATFPDGSAAICRDTRAFLIVHPGGGLSIGAPCPPTIGQNAAIVKTNHPRFLSIGIFLIAFSSIVGIFLGEGPERRIDRAERRRQMKLFNNSHRFSN